MSEPTVKQRCRHSARNVHKIETAAGHEVTVAEYDPWWPLTESRDRSIAITDAHGENTVWVKSKAEALELIAAIHNALPHLEVPDDYVAVCNHNFSTCRAAQ